LSALTGSDENTSECGACDPAVVERFGQRGFVDDIAAGDVDEQGRGFHPAELLGADQPPRVSVERTVDRHHVGPCEQFVERKGGVGLLACDARRRVVAHLAAESRSQSRHFTADRTQPDDHPNGARAAAGSDGRNRTGAASGRNGRS